MNYFNFDGVYHTGGECLLFPSKEMQDWSKFAWKKGDVLVNGNNAHIIFEKFSNDTYTTFIGKYYCDGVMIPPDEKYREKSKAFEELEKALKELED
ncbi:MAG: hypothetical protein [Bacteriophage sp.]|nr:MAG: hypothetical protein [Bacteriophage sp.]